MTTSTFRFIDIFAGIGGMWLGLEKAGGICVYSSEINAKAAETYASNFGDIPDGDITRVRTRDVPDHDLLAAGFPCQPFSIAGVSKRNSLGMPTSTNAPEGRLFEEIVRILRAHRPHAFLLENVKSLVTYGAGGIFEGMCRKLKGAGYAVKYKIIDARLLVPQHHERVFVVGVRGRMDFDFPEIMDREPRLGDILERRPSDKYVISDRTWKWMQRHRRNSRARGAGFGYVVANRGGISNTLPRHYYKSGMEILISRGDGKRPRKLTPRECARLMGFPDSFQIPVSDTQAYMQFGNSVVPGIVARIGTGIARCLATTAETIGAPGHRGRTSIR